MRLENKIAVVTGASSGMGYDMARRFVEEGASVVAVARRVERLQKLVEECSSLPGKIAVYPADLMKKEGNEGMIDFCIDTFGGMDILINNAGVMDNMASVANVTDERFEQVMQLNVYAPMYAMRKAVNYWLQNDRKGCILNISSIGGLRPVAGFTYMASKSALIAMTKNTSYMFRNQGIRCNAIAPGTIETEITSSMGQPDVESFNKLRPFFATANKPGKGTDIANAALFLCSDEASYISGDVLVVDGGWLS